MKKQILTDDKPVQRWLRKSFSIQAELIGETKKREAKNLIFIMDKFHLDEYDKLMIKNNVDITRAETVTVFVFFTKPKGKKTSSSNKHDKKVIEIQQNIVWIDTDEDVGNDGNALLQSELETLFPEKKCRVITKEEKDSKWEMVLLGIGVLKDCSFEESLWLDMRRRSADKLSYEIILRSFHDVIVYDKDQKYMFMNLN